MRMRQQAPADDRRDQRDGAQIQQQREPARRSTQGLGAGTASLRRLLELAHALVDQVVADVPCAIARPAFCRGACQTDRRARHLAFGQRAALRHALRCMAVAIAGNEIHPAIDATRILAQRLLDDAHGLDELAPVRRAQDPQAADAVADGNLIGGLLLVLRLDQLLDRQARFGQSLLDPGQRQGQGGAPALQAARQLRDERADHRRIRARHVRDHQNQALRILLGGFAHLVRPGAGQVSLGTAGGDAHADAAQVLDQRQAQHDGDRPQLAQPEGSDRLVGRHEAAQTFRVHPTVAMRNGLQRDVVHARTPGRRAVSQARQFPAVTLRQVPLGGANLLFDQIEIIEQPFPGRRDAAALRDRLGQLAAHSDQGTLVRCQPRQQPVRRAPRRQLVRGRKRLAMQLHLVGAEQLASERRFFVQVIAWQAACAKPRIEPSQIFDEHRASVQFRRPMPVGVARPRRSAAAGGRTRVSPRHNIRTCALPASAGPAR